MRLYSLRRNKMKFNEDVGLRLYAYEVLYYVYNMRIVCNLHAVITEHK